MTATKRAVASNELTMALSPLEVNARIVQIRNLIISGCPRTERTRYRSTALCWLPCLSGVRPSSFAATEPRVLCLGCGGCGQAHRPPGSA